jgi:hypothetical protein
LDDDIFDDNIEPENDVLNGDVFEGISHPENKDGEEGLVPIGELIYHQVMTAVSSTMLQFVHLFNELGNVRLLKENDIAMFIDNEETGDDEDE